MKTHEPVSDAEAIDLVYCPTCHAPKGSMCVYLPKSSPAARNAHKTGQPMERVHNGRRDAARSVRRSRAYKDTHRAIEAAHGQRIGRESTPTTDAREIWTAEQRWEHSERAQLVMWLRAHSRVLTSASWRWVDNTSQGA